MIRSCREHPLTPRQIKSFRKRQGWSAYELARELGGLSRSYIKHLEGGSVRINNRFISRFRALRARVIGSQIHDREIVTTYRLPRRLVITVKPKRCDVCRWWFIPVSSRQKRCGPKCAKIARSRRSRAKAGRHPHRVAREIGKGQRADEQD